jgi:hypothetical protein
MIGPFCAGWPLSLLWLVVSLTGNPLKLGPRFAISRSNAAKTGSAARHGAV